MRISALYVAYRLKRGASAQPTFTAIDADDNELVLFDDEGSHRLGRSSKLEQARLLIRHIAKLYKPRKSVLTV